MTLDGFDFWDARAYGSEWSEISTSKLGTDVGIECGNQCGI
jgi:hypothetical protein